MEPGERVEGRYQIIERLYSDDWLEAHRVQDEQTGEQLVMHLYAADAAWQHHPRLDPRRRAPRLVALLADTDHPHLCCPRHYLTLSQGGIALLYPCIDGERLDQRLVAGSLPTDKALRVAIDLCKALHALHARGIVHRDIRPGNVLLADHGAVLTGMDWAQLPVDLAAGGPAERHPGSPAYMSPEQAGTSGALDARSDVYSVALLLTKLLGGAERPSASAPGMHGALGRVLARALQREPSQRYQTARDLQIDLEALAEGSLGGRLGLYARQLPGTLWAAGSLIVLALVWALLGLGPLGEHGAPTDLDGGQDAAIAWLVHEVTEPPHQALAQSEVAVGMADVRTEVELGAQDRVMVELGVGQYIERSFLHAGETHHAAARVAGGRGYVIATTNLASGVDTFLDVSYDGQRISNDDAWPGTLASRVFVMPPQDATLWIQVSNRGVVGENATYELLVVEAEPTPTATLSPTVAWTPADAVTMTPRPTFTPRATATPTTGATRTPRPTSTPWRTNTPRPTMSPTPSGTPTSVPTARPTATATPPRTVLPVKTPITPVW